MIVLCPHCRSQQNIVQSGIFNCQHCGAAMSVSQEAIIAHKMNPDSTKKHKITPMIILFILLFFTLAAASGFYVWKNWKTYFPDHALKYVPENAEIIIYGNAKTFFDNKLYKIAQKNGLIPTEVTSGIKEALGIGKPEELSGSIVLWGNAKSEMEDAYILVVFDNAWADKFCQNADNENIIKINSHTVLLSLSGKKITVQPEFKNSLARQIDPNAVLAIGVSQKTWQYLVNHEENKDSAKMKNLATAGDLIVEMFLNDERIQIRGNLDISQIKE